MKVSLKRGRNWRNLRSLRGLVRPGRKDGWGNCSGWYKPNRGPGKIRWVIRKVENASVSSSWYASMIPACPGGPAFRNLKKMLGPGGPGTGRRGDGSGTNEAGEEGVGAKTGWGMPQARWRMAAPTGGTKSLPDGVGTWLSAVIAEGGDAGVEGTCNDFHLIEGGVDMWPAALFHDDGFGDNDELYATAGVMWYEDIDCDKLINSQDADWDGDEILNSVDAGLTMRNEHTAVGSVNFVKDADFGATVTDPFADADLDNDLIPDKKEDIDKNGRWDEGETDFNNADTDGDSLDDFFETTTAPTELTNYENNFETDPLNADTDGDTLSDSFEIFTDESCGNLYSTDPTSLDTDEDEINDNMEIEGWSVTVIWGTTKEKNVHRSKDNVHSDPTLRDTDGDGMSDKEEYGISDPTAADTDLDGIPDNKEEHSGNLTEIEADPPIIFGSDKDEDGNMLPEVHLDNWMEVEYWHGIPCDIDWFVSAYVNVYDSVGIDRIKIYVEKEGWQTINVGGDKKSIEEKLEWEVSGWKALTNGFDIEVEVYDINENGASTDTHLDGLLEGIAKALLAFLVALAKAIVELVASVFDWIWDFIKDIGNVILKPIIDMYNDWKKQVIEAFSSVTTSDDNYNRAGLDIYPYATSLSTFLFNKIILHPFTQLLFGITTFTSVVFLVAGVFVTFVSGGATSFIKPVVNMIIEMIMKVTQDAVSKHGTYLTVMIALGFIYETIPKNDPAWSWVEGGFEVAELMTPLALVALNHLSVYKLGLDVYGVIVSILGLGISRIVPGILGAFAAAVLGAIGFLYTLVNIDKSDSIVFGLWEEIITGICFAIDIAQLVRILTSRPKGIPIESN